MDEDKTSKAGDKKILDTARDRYKKASEHWDKTRKAYVEDQKFLAGEQWPAALKKSREDDGRPVLVVDKLNQYRRQVSNDIRQNRPQAYAFPVGDGDEDVAQAFQGLIRNTWSRSSADEATDWAADCAVSGGIGFIRVLTEYINDNSFDQDLVIRRVRNPISVTLDPSAQMSDGSDAKYGFIEEMIPKEEYKLRFPKAKETDWASEGFKDGWGDGDDVRVCEYFYVENRERTLLLLSDGTTVTQEQYDTAKMEGLPVPEIERTEKRPSKQVKWCRLSGCEILEKKDWAGKYVPLVPVYGEERDIEGEVTFTGLIRPAKDAQRVYNYSRCAFVERVALTPKAPWVAAAGQVEAYPEWQSANTGNHSVLRYDPIGLDQGQPLPPPQRVSASDVPAGFAQDAQMSEHDIQASMGMYNSSLGERSNETSGKAIMARQREGDVATFHFVDNLSRATRQVGRILVDLYPKILDSRRVVRLLDETGEATMAMVDPDQEEPVTEVDGMKIYNLGAGEYDVDVKSGPSYTTKRAEASDAMMQMSQGNPQVFPLIGDLMVTAMDWPGSEQMAKRLKAMLPPQIQQMESNEKQSPELMQLKQAADQAIGQREEALNQMQQQMQQMGQKLQELTEAREQKMRELDLKAAEIKVKAYQAETDRMTAVAPAMTPEQVQALVMQTLTQLATPADLGGDQAPPDMPPMMPPMMEPEQPPMPPGVQ